jgi:hypothetical protein
MVDYSFERGSLRTFGSDVSKEVLVVEPDADIAASVTQALQMRGYNTVLVVSTVDGARVKLNERAYNTVLCEWHPHVAATLSRDYGVVVLSGLVLLGEPTATDEWCFLPRPLNPASLAFAITMLFGDATTHSLPVN